MDRQQAQSFASNPRLAASIRRSLAADESSNMFAVLSVDELTPVPPAPTNIRVRNMGKNIKERFEVCQWIQDMTDEPEAPKKSEAEAILKSEIAGALEHASGIGDSGQAAASETKPGGEKAVISFAEQLDAIRQQQNELMEKQKVIQDLLDKRQGSSVDSSSSNLPASVNVEDGETVKEHRHQAGKETSVASTLSQSVMEPSNMSLSLASANGNQVKPRRLKGSLASLYAQRNEGSIGALIWEEKYGEETPAAASASSCKLAEESRSPQVDLRRDKSSNVSELLSQCSFFSSRSYRGSDTSVVSPLSRHTQSAGAPSSTKRCEEKPSHGGAVSQAPLKQRVEAEQHGYQLGDGEPESECATSKCEKSTA